MWKRLDKATLHRESNLPCRLGTLPDQFLYWLHVVSAENCITTKIYDSGNYRCWPVCFECRSGLSLGMPRFDWKGALKDWCTWSDFVCTVSAHFQGEKLENHWDNIFFLFKTAGCTYVWVFKLHKLSYWSNISIGGTSVIEDKTKLQACLSVVSKGFEFMQHLSWNTY